MSKLTQEMPRSIEEWHKLHRKKASWKRRAHLGNQRVSLAMLSMEFVRTSSISSSAFPMHFHLCSWQVGLHVQHRLEQTDIKVRQPLPGARLVCYFLNRPSTSPLVPLPSPALGSSVCHPVTAAPIPYPGTYKSFKRQRRGQSFASPKSEYLFTWINTCCLVLKRAWLLCRHHHC